MSTLLNENVINFVKHLITPIRAWFKKAQKSVNVICERTPKIVLLIYIWSTHKIDMSISHLHSRSENKGCQIKQDCR